MNRHRWDRDSIREALRRYHRRGEDLAYNAMCATNQALVSAAAYHFGSYRRAVLMSGLEYGRICKKPRWTEKKIVSMLRRAHRQGEDLSWRAVIARGDELARAAMAAVHPQLFGHWNSALEAAGLSRDRVARYHRWTHDAIIAELQRRKRSRHPVSAGSIQASLPGLYGAAVRIFGSYARALKAAGIEPADVARRRQWTRASVIAALRQFARDHKTWSHATLRQHDSGLMRAMYKYFGTIEEARRKVGPQPARGIPAARPSKSPEPRRRPQPGESGQPRWKAANVDERQLPLFDDLPPLRRRRAVHTGLRRPGKLVIA